MSEHGKYLSPLEAAAYLGIPKKTLADWRLNRRGPRFARISRRYVRYALADLDAWIVSKQIATDDQPLGSKRSAKRSATDVWRASR